MSEQPVYDSNLRRLLSASDAPVVPREEYRAAVREEALNVLRAHRRLRWWTASRRILIAAGALAAAAGALLALKPWSRPGAPPPPRLTVLRAPSDATVRLPTGSDTAPARDMRLPPGSTFRNGTTVAHMALPGDGTLELAPRARVTVGARDDVIRLDLEAGALYVSVDAHAPVVATPSATVRTLGTQFSVELTPGGRTNVVVARGRVETVNAHGRQEVEAGTRCVVEPECAPATPRRVDVDVMLAWRRARPEADGRLLFEADLEDGTLSGWEAGRIEEQMFTPGSRFAIAAVPVEGETSLVARMPMARKPLFSVRRPAQVRFRYWGTSPEIYFQMWNVVKARNFRRQFGRLPHREWVEVVVDVFTMYRGDPKERDMKIEDGDGMCFLQFYASPGRDGGAVALFDDIRVLQFEPQE